MNQKNSLSSSSVFVLLQFIFFCLQPIQALGQGFGPEPQPGWHSSIGLGLGSMEQTKMSQKTIDAYDEDPQKKAKIVPIPHFHLYHIDDDRKSNWSFNTKRGSLFLERNQDLGIGMFSLKAGTSFPDLGFEMDRGIYENPYLLNEEREPTTMSKLTYSASFSSGKRLGFALGFQSDKVSFENDTTPEINSDLGRNGTKSTSTIGFNFYFLRYRYKQIKMDAEGKADSNNGMNQQLSLNFPLFTRGLMLITNFTKGEAIFDKEHPIFEKTREDNHSSQMAQLRWNSESYTFYVMYMSVKKNSNIDFFDEQLTLKSIGMNWKF